MPGQASLSFSGDRMCVSGVIDFASVIPLESEGQTWLRQEAPEACVVDMGGVSQCNSAGAALLLSWLRTAGNTGKTLRIERLPENLLAQVHLADLEDVLPASQGSGA